MMARVLFGAVALGLASLAAAAEGDWPGSFANPKRFETTEGAFLYRAACQGCHMPDGRGATGAGTYPALANNPKLAASSYPLYMVVNGRGAMPEFGSQLNDEQVAAVVNYVRTHFGNHYTDVATASDVRAVTPKPQPEAAKWLQVSPRVFLRYQRTGNGRQPVVLLHALGTSLENWDEVVPMLASKERTVLRFDQRGAGMSSKIRERVTMDVWVDDLLALLDRLGLKEPAVLVGDTFGATIALQFAATHPDRAAGVVALGPTAYLAPNPQQVAKFPDPLAPGAGPATLADRSLKLDPNDPDFAHQGRAREFDVVYPKVLRTDERRSDRYFGAAYSTDPTSAVLTLRAVYSVGFKEVFARVRCPVIMTAGRLFVRPVAAVRELSNAIPSSRLVELQTGHHAGAQSPELVGPLVENFLKELGR